MAVTTLADVEAALVRSVTPDEFAHVDRIIELVEADVLGRLPGYDLEPAGAETITLAGSYCDRLTLPSYPVSTVASVSVGGVAQSALTWTWTAKGYLSRVFGSSWPAINATAPDGTWGDPSQVVTVTYTHGQPASGSPLVLLIAEAVAAKLTGAGRAGMRSMSIDTYSESYESSEAARRDGGIDPKRLAPFRRSALGSVALT